MCECLYERLVSNANMWIDSRIDVCRKVEKFSAQVAKNGKQSARNKRIAAEARIEREALEQVQKILEG